MFSVMCVCLFTRGGPHVTITHDAIGQSQVMRRPPGPRAVNKQGTPDLHP